jgi:hypothetical protein
MAFVQRSSELGKDPRGFPDLDLWVFGVKGR